jgi:endoglycosylceramidase
MPMHTIRPPAYAARGRPALAAVSILITLATLAAWGASPAWAVAAPAQAPAAAASPDAWAGAGVVQAPGGAYLTDALGRRLELHGVNVVGKCGGGARDTNAPGTPCVGPARGPNLAFVLSPNARDPGRRFTAGDARTLARMGFDMVRLGIIWEGLEPGPRGVGPNDPRYCTPHRRGTRFPSLGAAEPYDPRAVHAYLARTDRIVELLSNAGIRVVLDMHQDVWGSAFSYGLGLTPWNGEGAPPWATCYGGGPFVAPISWGDAYLTSPVEAALHNFWANDVRADLQGEYARVWQAVASHYRGDPNVIGYEVFNEPNDLLTTDVNSELECDYGGPAHEPRSCAISRVAALPDGLIGAIESADPTHLVLFEPSGDTAFGQAETIGIAEPLRFPRLALAFHVYGSAPAQLRQVARERAGTRTEQSGGPPWIMDEFGASNNAPLTGATVALADQVNLSWTYWAAMQFDDPTGGDAYEGLLNQMTRKPYPAMARALAVPYPAATAGTPGRQRFTAGTLTFVYDYRSNPSIGAPTEVVVPSYTFSHGYTAQASGARIVSAANAPMLELQASTAAHRVEVTVRPRRGLRRAGRHPAAARLRRVTDAEISAIGSSMRR